MQLIQVEFEKLGQKKLVWVDSSWNLKIGMSVEFEGEDSAWTVVKIYETKIDSVNLYCKWGLDLPKTYRTER